MKCLKKVLLQKGVVTVVLAILYPGNGRLYKRLFIAHGLVLLLLLDSVEIDKVCGKLIPKLVGATYIPQLLPSRRATHIPYSNFTLVPQGKVKYL